MVWSEDRLCISVLLECGTQEANIPCSHCPWVLGLFNSDPGLPHLCRPGGRVHLMRLSERSIMWLHTQVPEGSRAEHLSPARLCFGAACAKTDDLGCEPSSL